MRHRSGLKRLGRPTDQRLAILKSLVAAMIDHRSVITTETRAKEARPVIERIITLGREDTLANRRLARRWVPIGKRVTTREKYENVHGDAPAYKGHLKGKDMAPSGERLIRILFEEIGPQFKERNGGYLRITRLGGEPHVNAKGELTARGARRGDAAAMVKLEFVD
jgi:large subunit ribosomal protein L17